MYQVVAGKNISKFQNRKDAIIAARRVSRRCHQDVMVLHEAGMERMVYRRGRIESGAYGKERPRRAFR
ncbi:MAG: hypothetical protein ACI8RZ_001831 [Myxococcota bacterium]|jgi:hypothetical protein